MLPLTMIMRTGIPNTSDLHTANLDSKCVSCSFELGETSQHGQVRFISKIIHKDRHFYIFGLIESVEYLE